jgi:hypothetical protein
MSKRKSATVTKLSPEEHLAALVREEQIRRGNLERSIENAVAFFETEGLPPMAEIEEDAPYYKGLFGSAESHQQEADNIEADMRDWHIAVNDLLEAKGLGVKAWKEANKKRAA